MKIIFVKDQPGGGVKGQIKEVNEGFARNFLIPKGFAQVATSQIQGKIAKEQKEAEQKQQKDLERTRQLQQELEKRTFTVKIKVGEQGQIFSGVHEKDIAAAINQKLNTNLEKNNVVLPKPIKELGEHLVKLKLEHGLSAIAKIHVEPT